MAAEPSLGRLRAAWRVLTGRALVDDQLGKPDRELRTEWLEYQQTFDDILTKLGAQLARSARARKKELEERLQMSMLDELPQRDVPDPNDRHARKAELNKRAAARRGLRVSGGGAVHQPEEHP